MCGLLDLLIHIRKVLVDGLQARTGWRRPVLGGLTCISGCRHAFGLQKGRTAVLGAISSPNLNVLVSVADGAAILPSPTF